MNNFLFDGESNLPTRYDICEICQLDPRQDNHSMCVGCLDLVGFIQERTMDLIPTMTIHNALYYLNWNFRALANKMSRENDIPDQFPTPSWEEIRVGLWDLMMSKLEEEASTRFASQLDEL